MPNIPEICLSAQLFIVLQRLSDKVLGKLEYLQMNTFQGQTYNLRTHELVDKYTSLTFPNIAYRVEF